MKKESRSVFDTVQYISSTHAENRFIERILPCSREEAKEVILHEVKNGTLLIDVNNHRYLRNGNLFFPCVKTDNGHFKVKSVLTWEMVEHRLQSAIDNYADFVSDLL